MATANLSSIDGMPVISCEAQLDPNIEAQAILSDSKKVNRFIHPVRMIIAGKTNNKFQRLMQVGGVLLKPSLYQAAPCDHV